MKTRTVGLFACVFASITVCHLIAPALSQPQVDVAPPLASAARSAAELSVERLIIKDKHGRDRIAMGTANDNPFILILDAKQTPRLQIALEADGTCSLNIYDDKRRSHVELAYLPSGIAELTLLDSVGRSAVAAARPKAVSGFGVYDEKLRADIAMVVEPDGARTLMATDESGRLRVDLGVSAQKTAGLHLINSEGQKKTLREPK